ncbi:short-chain dehydrogenase reductase family [Colletotrichum plurivorum]|uniref:Short-chain dehydrogenase reductase family n=1 Tax=Colletotrichum plurivorum TaxID=2175906 RepID=A0A8H6K8C4_9PEZI|nr:short-chain dehydrogenase reductase family [Colletotrichum plurivorum]
MDVPGYALITGAASGIGLATARAFALEGSAGLALVDLSSAALDAAESLILSLFSSSTNLSFSTANLSSSSAKTSSPPKILKFPISVTDESAVINTIQSVKETFGRIDYVVNAAGIALKHPGGTAFCATEDFQRVVDVNVNGTFYVLREAARIMLDQEPILSERDGRPLQRGSIVNFGSIQGVAGITLSTAYTTTKHAVIGLTRTASEDYAARGLRINAICPGYTETPMTTKNPEVLKAMEERVATAVPMERMGKASEIADGVLYLAGGRSSFVTGSVLMVDGGYTCR